MVRLSQAVFRDLWKRLCCHLGEQCGELYMCSDWLYRSYFHSEDLAVAIPCSAT